MWKLYKSYSPEDVTNFLNSLYPDIAKTVKIVESYCSPTLFYIWYKE